MESDVALGLPGIVLQEVLSGIPSEKQFADLRAKLLTGFAVVPASTQDHVDAARLKNACANKGLNASGIDCLIAASVIATSGAAINRYIIEASRLTIPVAIIATLNFLLTMAVIAMITIIKLKTIIIIKLILFLFLEFRCSALSL